MKKNILRRIRRQIQSYLGISLSTETKWTTFLKKIRIVNGFKYRRYGDKLFDISSVWQLDCFCPAYIIIFGIGFVPFGWQKETHYAKNEIFMITLFNFDFILYERETNGKII